jgi:RNA polymerase sigma-70 factor (ECF subfamily)
MSISTSLEKADSPTLVAAIRAGDPKAPRELWQRFGPMVFRILRRMLGPKWELDDLAQEVFLRVFRNLPRLRDPVALKAFVIAVSVGTARGGIRDWGVRKRGTLAVRPLRAALETPPADIEARAALEGLYRILARLRPDDRTAFILRFMEQMELVDVAAAMDVSLATVKRRVTRAWTRVSFHVARDPSLAHYRLGPV